MRPPRLHQRLWYRRNRLPVPLSVGPTGPWHADWIRLLPQSWSGVHRAYARRWGFYWLPCVLCGALYGGHQAAGSVPDPTEGPGRGIAICPSCTRAGRGWTARLPVEDLLDEVADRYEHDGHDYPVDPECSRCVEWHYAILDVLGQEKDRGGEEQA